MSTTIANRPKRYKRAHIRGYHAHEHANRERNPYSPQNPGDRRAWFDGWDLREAEENAVPEAPKNPYTQYIAECVQTGAELLDRKQPDWFRRIDLETLNLESCTVCVVGQLFGREYEPRMDGVTDVGLFRHVEAVLGLEPESVCYWRNLEDYGFALRSPYYNSVLDNFIPDLGEESAPYWEHLTTLWKNEIQKRLSNA